MGGKLTFGYLYDCRNPAPFARDWHALYAEVLDDIAHSEALGFAGAWFPEHHGAEDGFLPAPHLMIAAAATRTSRIRLGSAIALAPLYHPLRFAEECALLDQLCGGRLDVALAIGYRAREYAAFGEDVRKRGARFDEFLAVVKRLWAGERVSHDGAHYRLTDAHITPPPRGPIPLFIGGFAEKALARVARHADGYFGNEEVCGLYAEKLRAAGKDPAAARIRIQSLFVTVARDKAAAMEELAPYYHHVSNSYGAWMAEDVSPAGGGAIGLDAPALKTMSRDGFKASGILTILTPDEAIAHFRGLHARVGAEHVMMMRPPGLSAERFRAYARLFAEAVMPAFA